MPEDLAQEELGALRLRIVEEGLGFVLLDDLALVHEDHPVGHGLGEAHLALGDIEAALAILAVPEQLDVPLAEHAFGWRYLFLAQGTALLAAGQADDARRVAERALALAQERGEPPQSAYARKLLGDVARAGGKSNAALATRHYEEALALAEQCAMRPLVRLCREALADGVA